MGFGMIREYNGIPIYVCDVSDKDSGLHNHYGVEIQPLSPDSNPLIIPLYDPSKSSPDITTSIRECIAATQADFPNSDHICVYFRHTTRNLIGIAVVWKNIYSIRSSLELR